MSDYIIKTENLAFSYENPDEYLLNGLQHSSVLQGINFSVKRGEYVAILGRNGSGKSTLAKLLNLILTATSGKIYIDGKDVTNPNFTEDDLFDVRRDVGMVFQNPDNQLVATVVEEDVAFGPENLGLPREEIRKRVNDALNLVGMSAYSKHAPHKLSGGQKQRVAIAGVIAMKPRVIIFDEATAMLDPSGRRDVMEIIDRLNREEGITVINITHYMDEAARADRVIVINDGKIELNGTPHEVFSSVDRIKAMGLDVPQGAELIHRLRGAGIKIEGNILTEAECTEALLKILKHGN